MQSSKVLPAHFVWLIATALLVASVPLDIAALILFYYTLFCPLPLTFTLPYCTSQGLHFSSVFCAELISDTLKNYALEIIRCFLNASTVACHIANLPRKKVCSPMVSALWYTGTRLSTIGRQYFSSHSTSNKTPLRSLTPSVTLQEVSKFSGRTKYTSSNASPRVGFFITCV
jgi:hypothetical protein